MYKSGVGEIIWGLHGSVASTRSSLEKAVFSGLRDWYKSAFAEFRNCRCRGMARFAQLFNKNLLWQNVVKALNTHPQSTDLVLTNTLFLPVDPCPSVLLTIYFLRLVKIQT
jgi:hypothetical protein